MKKLKKSLSVLLTLVMLFTTLCFFSPDFGVEANAAATSYKWRITVYMSAGSKYTDSGNVTIYWKTNNGTGAAGSYQIYTGAGDGAIWTSDGQTTMFVSDSSLSGTVVSGIVPANAYPYQATATIDIGSAFVNKAIDWEVKIEVFDTNGNLITDSNYGNKEEHTVGWGDGKEYTSTDTIDVSYYPYVTSVNIVDTTKYIPEDGSSVTETLNITAVDQYGVDWVNAPTTSVSNSNSTVTNGTSKTPTLTFNNANTDYTTTVSSSWTTGNSSYPTVTKTVAYNVYIPRTIYFNDNSIFKLSDWTTIGGGCTITNLTDKSFTATSAVASDGNTGFSHLFPLKPNTTYVFSADTDYVPQNANDTFDVYFQPRTESGYPLEGTVIVEGCKTEGAVYVSSTGHKSDVKKVRLVFTTTADTAQGCIRFDANNQGNVLNVSNIKFVELSQENVPSYTLTVKGDKQFKSYTAEVPTSTGYTFQGWYLGDDVCFDANGNWASSNSELYVKDYLTFNTKYSETLTSKWTENKYNIRFDANNGTGTTMADIADVLYTAKQVLPVNTYTRTGYTFNGWNTSADGNGTAIANGATVQKLSAANGATVTLYAQWTPNNYTINFNGNTGTGSMSGVTATYDKDTVLPENTFEKVGYTFTGWNTAADGNGTGYADKGTVKNLVASGATTLYAQWAINKYTITFDTDGGSAVAPITQDYNTAVTAPAAPTKTGYTFAGWDKDIPDNMPAENITIKAMWTVNQYTISFDTDGGSAVASITQDYNTAVTEPAAPTKTGYTFAGWTPGVPSTMPAENITLTAQWTANEYIINYDTVGGSSVESQTATYDKEIALGAAPTKTGYVFKGWQFDGATYDAGKAVINLATSGSVTMTAVWEANTYTVTFDKNDEAATGEMDEQSFTYDEAQKLTGLGYAKEGWHFVEWNTSADGKGTGYADLAEVINLTADADGEVTLYAQWTINLYDVTFKYFTKTGEAKETIVEDVPHGTAFDTIVPADFVETYYVATASKDAPHYNFNAWENGVDEITAEAVFEAAYTEEAHEYYDKIGTSYGATCTEKGLKAEYCDCGYEYTEEIPALGHDWAETGRTATCTEAGVINYKCVRANCNATKQEVLEALGHIDGEWKVTTEAGCITKGEESHYCGRCNEIWETKEIAAAGHSFSATVVAEAPTCVLTGNVEYKQCENCALYFEADATVDSADGKATNEDFILPANGHKTVLVPAVQPKCEEDGNIAYYTCENCDLLFADADAQTIISAEDTVDPMTGHDDSGEWIETTAPKCETMGEETLYCETCGKAIDTREVAVLGHDYETKVTAPTCTEQGYTTYTCKNDSNHTYVADYVEATGHDYTGEWVETIAPGCETKGEEKLYCVTCNAHIDTREVEARGHDYETKITPPTCSEQGFTTYTCSRCDHSYDADYVAANGHTEAKRQEVIHAATCTVAGDYWDITYCSVCDEEINRVQVTGQTLPHTYTQRIIDADHLKEVATCVKYAVYYYDCVNCDANAKDVGGATFEYAEGGFDTENHIGTTTTGDEDIVPGTCNTEKTWNEVTRCDDCNEIITSVPKTGEKDSENHVGETYEGKDNEVAGTCSTVATWDTVTYCADCNTEIGRVSEKGEKDPANHSTTETVLKNDKAATCCEKGYTGDLHCADCDAIVTPGTVIDENKDSHAGGTRVEKEAVVPGTCITPEKWNEATYCVGCGEKLGTVAQTGEIDEANHKGETRVEKIDEVAGTCETAAAWTEVTYCEDCGNEIGREAKTGEKDPANHTGETYTEKINEVSGNCAVVATWTEVTYCKGCDAELDREDKVGETDPTVHTGETYTKDEDIVEGTCKSEKTWNEVTFCSGCDEKLSSVAKTGEKDENNHIGAADKVVGYKAPTCKDEGYTGDTYWNCCDKLYSTGASIPTTEHTASEAVKENEIPATETEDGSYESVVYCSVCGEEISRETVAIRLERTITFVMLDKTVEVKAYNGDTVTLPEVADYTGTDGFIYKFKSWDKAVAVVNGDATYTAVYTEPCDYSELDALEETLNEVLNGDLVDDAVLEENKAKIEEVLARIEEINAERNTRDKSEQNIVDFVAGEIGGLIDIIYPDAGSTLVIEGSSVAYIGTVLDLKAIKMPLGTVLTDAQWTSSDDSIVFFSNGRLYAVGTGTVTLTATRGILEASKVVTIIEGGNTRGINFTSINNTHFIIEDYKAVYNSAIVYWSDDFDLRFRVRVYQSFMFEDYIVYINGQEAEPDAEGYYVVPAGSGDAIVTIAGAVIDTGDGEGETVTKWSFWEWLLNLFRKIINFFKDIFGIA